MKPILAALLALAISGCTVVTASRYGGNGGTVLLCHKGKKTLELPSEATRAHIDHGDRYGPC
jgi:hypothetical protein